MKCETHQDRDAVGLCLACHRGICAECRTFVQDTVACLGRCESRVMDIVHLQARNLAMDSAFVAGAVKDEHLEAYEGNRKASLFWLLVLCCAAAYLLFWFVGSLGQRDAALTPLWLLVVVVGLGISAYSSMKKWRRLVEQRRKIGDMWRSR